MKWIDRAVSALSPRTSLRVSISRKPFFLYPGGKPSAQLPSKWGERVSKLYSEKTWEHIVDLGQQAGYSFNFNSELSDTLDSHRLALLAEKQGKQKEVVHEISRRYFEEGVQLADRNNLLDVAHEFGVEGAKDYLDSTEGVDDVLSSVRFWVREKHVESIPVALITSGNFSTTVHGSAAPTEFLQIFRQIESYWLEQQSHTEL